MEYQPKLNEKYSPYLDCISSLEQLKVLLKIFLKDTIPSYFIFEKNPKHKSQVELNIHPSLSYNRIDLLRKANELIEGNENFKFAYADMHGNLKFILKNKPLNRKHVLPCRTKKDIVNIIPTVKKMNSNQPLVLHPYENNRVLFVPYFCLILQYC